MVSHLLVEELNPHRKEVRIELIPEKMALLQLFPRDVASALLPQLTAYNGGSFTEGLNKLTNEMPPMVRTALNQCPHYEDERGAEFDIVRHAAGRWQYQAHGRGASSDSYRAATLVVPDRAGLSAANSDRSQNQFQTENVYLKAEERAARALFDLVEKIQSAEVYHRSEQSVPHFLEIAQARFAKSLLSREDADRLVLDAANAEARWTDAEI